MTLPTRNLANRRMASNKTFSTPAVWNPPHHHRGINKKGRQDCSSSPPSPLTAGKNTSNTVHVMAGTEQFSTTPSTPSHRSPSLTTSGESLPSSCSTSFFFSSSFSSSSASCSSSEDAFEAFSVANGGSGVAGHTIQQEYWKRFSTALHDSDLVQEYLYGLVEEEEEESEPDREHEVGAQGCRTHDLHPPPRDTTRTSVTVAASPPRINRWNPYRCPPKSPTLQEENRRSQLMEFLPWVPRCALFLRGTGCCSPPPTMTVTTGGESQRDAVSHSSTPPQGSTLFSSGGHLLHGRRPTSHKRGTAQVTLTEDWYVPSGAVRTSLALRGQPLFPRTYRTPSKTPTRTRAREGGPSRFHPEKEQGKENEEEEECVVEEVFASHGIVSHTVALGCRVASSRHPSRHERGEATAHWDLLPLSCTSTIKWCGRRGSSGSGAQRCEECSSPPELCHLCESVPSFSPLPTPEARKGENEKSHENTSGNRRKIKKEENNRKRDVDVEGNAMAPLAVPPSISSGSSGVNKHLLSCPTEDKTSPHHLQKEAGRPLRLSSQKPRRMQNNNSTVQEAKAWRRAVKREVEDAVFALVWEKVILPFYHDTVPFSVHSSTALFHPTTPPITPPTTMSPRSSSYAVSATPFSCSFPSSSCSGWKRKGDPHCPSNGKDSTESEKGGVQESNLETRTPREKEEKDSAAVQQNTETPLLSSKALGSVSSPQKGDEAKTTDLLPFPTTLPSSLPFPMRRGTDRFLLVSERDSHTMATSLTTVGDLDGSPCKPKPQGAYRLQPSPLSSRPTRTGAAPSFHGVPFVTALPSSLPPLPPPTPPRTQPLPPLAALSPDIGSLSSVEPIRKDLCPTSHVPSLSSFSFSPPASSSWRWGSHKVFSTPVVQAKQRAKPHSLLSWSQLAAKMKKKKKEEEAMKEEEDAGETENGEDMRKPTMTEVVGSVGELLQTTKHKGAQESPFLSSPAVATREDREDTHPLPLASLPSHWHVPLTARTRFASAYPTPFTRTTPFAPLYRVHTAPPPFLTSALPPLRSPLSFSSPLPLLPSLVLSSEEKQGPSSTRDERKK